MRTREQIIADLDKNEIARNRLERRFWKASEKLTDEWEALMEELKNA